MRLGPLIALALGAAALAGAAPSGPPSPLAARVARCELTGTVDAGSAAYLARCVEQARAQGHAALLIRVDTPGGSLAATRQAVRALLASPVPVLVWVGPSGAHAGSAGLFFVLASHVAGMAPGTNLGAAHPVVAMPGPEGADFEPLRKAENDAAAFAESLARLRGRNADWAVRAVRESATLSADRARQAQVVELLAASEEDLLGLVDGRAVRVGEREVTLRTAEAELVDLRPTLGQRLVHALANPGLAYLLFLLGSLGLMIELTHPGFGVPGVLGLLSLLLAMIAFSALPIRAGAVALLVLGAALVVAEAFAGQGFFAAAGTLALALGGVLLVDRLDPGWFIDRRLRLSAGVVLPTAAVVGAAALALVWRAAQARALPQLGGDQGLLRERGTTLTAVGPEGGEVFIHGERWLARSAARIPPDTPVEVREVSGLTLEVQEVGHGALGASVRVADSPRSGLPRLRLRRADRQ